MKFVFQDYHMFTNPLIVILLTFPMNKYTKKKQKQKTKNEFFTAYKKLNLIFRKLNQVCDKLDFQC